MSLQKLVDKVKSAIDSGDDVSDFDHGLQFPDNTVQAMLNAKPLDYGRFMTVGIVLHSANILEQYQLLGDIHTLAKLHANKRVISVTQTYDEFSGEQVDYSSIAQFVATKMHIGVEQNDNIKTGAPAPRVVMVRFKDDPTIGKRLGIRGSRQFHKELAHLQSDLSLDTYLAFIVKDSLTKKPTVNTTGGQGFMTALDFIDPTNIIDDGASDGIPIIKMNESDLLALRAFEPYVVQDMLTTPAMALTHHISEVYKTVSSLDAQELQRALTYLHTIPEPARTFDDAMLRRGVQELFDHASTIGVNAGEQFAKAIHHMDEGYKILKSIDPNIDPQKVYENNSIDTMMEWSRRLVEDTAQQAPKEMRITYETHNSLYAPTSGAVDHFHLAQLDNDGNNTNLICMGTNQLPFGPEVTHATVDIDLDNPVLLDAQQKVLDAYGVTFT